MDSWETALDLDDSDLPSLLRPCKRQQPQQSQTSPDSLSNTNLASQHCSPTLPPPAYNQSQPPRHLIPGPAGGMQAAMHRIGQRNEHSEGNRRARVCTQDYIRTVEEDAAEDFASGRWISALDFLSRKGVRRTTSLNDIKNGLNSEKIDMVVAMIKCCTPNGLGDTMVVLKDPTDTMHATIHRKVLTEGDYGRQIAVGSVLLLQKVSVFSPLNKSFYLNISVSNVLKVFPKDTGRDNHSACTPKDAAPERHENLNMLEQVLSGTGRIPKAITDVNLNFNLSGTSYVQKHAGKENFSLGNQIIVDQSSNKYTSLQHRSARDHPGSKVTREPSEVDLVSFSQEAVIDKLASISSCIEREIDLRDENIVKNLDGEHLSAANAIQKQAQECQEEQSHTGKLVFENLDGENVAGTQWQAKQNTNEFEKHNDLPASKDSFQDWTDEQLDILDMDY